MDSKLIALSDYLLSHIKKQVEYVEVRAEVSFHSSYILKNGALEASSSSFEKGISTRFTAKDSMGFFSTNNLSKDNLVELAEKAIRKSLRASKAERISLSDEPVCKAKYSVGEIKKVLDVSGEQKTDLLSSIDTSISNKSSERYLSLHDKVSETYFINSEGSRIQSRIPRISLYYNFSIKHLGRSSQRSWLYGASSGYEIFKKWNLQQKLSDEANALKKNLQFGIKPPRGKVDVVCAPEVVGIIVHESCGHPSEADRILSREAAQAGESFINPNMLGSKIGTPLVNIADDPTIPNSFGYYLYDDEGVKARRRMLFKDGKINEFLNNRETASQFSTHSNGAARAVNYNYEPIVRMANTYFVPQKMSEEELIESIRLGVYIRNFMEWNIDDLRLNQKYVGAEAYLIKNGRVVAPVIQPVIETTTPKLYSSVTAVANNLEFHAGTCGKGEPMQAIPVWFGGPSIKLHGINVSKGRGK
ncbi:MAG: TldD/PmbA family protein [Candidatus Woesearchaeota archaeon]